MERLDPKPLNVRRTDPKPSNEPARAAGENSFVFGSWLFLRLLALVHVIAFVSLWVQLEGLVGPDGLLPAADYFPAVRAQLGSSAYARVPTLCWFFGAGTFLHVLCGAGVLFSLLLFSGIAPAVCLAALWAAYLSLNYAGQVFFHFQWDTLLLETTLLALFFAPWSLLPLWRAYQPPAAARLILWWLLFRLMFLAGVVKLASGDSTWRDLSALTFHYETQPLPTPLAWFAHQLPPWWHRASCAGMFVLELAVPFFLFASRILRHNAALLLIAFMVAVALTGNYTFFNLLASVLCVACLDDAWWRAILPARAAWLRARAGEAPAPAARWQRMVAMPFAGFAIVYTLVQAMPSVAPRFGTFREFRHLAQFIDPFRSLNNYGLFAVMTNPRPELIFEGSDDRIQWRAYEFKHKPGALTQQPTWVAPHQPRLDWQLWFAALGSPQQNPWVISLCEHLLRGNPKVLARLAGNPFPGKPPRFVRIVRYEYHFTDAATRAATGHWWRRTPMDFYVPAASLR
ncbi:MAG: lipase maturation factor family protein [Opitutaceae bacterium]